MNNAQKIIFNLFWLVLLAVALWLGLQKVNTFLKLKAMGDCALSSQYQTKDVNGAIVSYPVKQVYEQCLKEKGY